MEMTLRHLTTGDNIDPVDFLQRADTLSALGKTVLISNFRRLHRLSAYLSRYNRPPDWPGNRRFLLEGDFRRDFLQ